MRIDEFGRRFVSVPARSVPAELICRDDSDSEFWSGLEALVGVPATANLGLVSDYEHKRFLSAPMAESSEWETEVFSHEYFLMSLGSSRHLGRGRYLWKGVGRNQLAVQSDWLHSWGGMTFTEGLNEYVLSRLLGKTCAVPVKALLRYKEKELGGSYFLLRDQEFPRLATVPYQHNLPACARALRDHLSRWSGTADPWEKFLETITTAYRKGFVHRSPTAGNFDVLGRLIDLTGSYYFPGNDVEIFWMNGSGNVENPLSPLMWMIETIYVPLYERILGTSSLRLRSRYEEYFSEHFHLFRRTPMEILRQMRSYSEDERKSFGNWMVIPAKAARTPILPKHSVTRKLELLAEALSPEGNAEELRRAIELMTENGQ